jgi:methylmalonyl-CoA epimerase
MKAILDHVGIAVKDLGAALLFYRDALGLEIEAPEEVTSQRVRAHFVPVGESNLELLEATAPDSPIAKYVEKRGPGLHHITLRVDDVWAAVEHLKQRQVRMIDETPRPGAEGSTIAFVHPAATHGVLIELKQAAPAVRPAVDLTVHRFALGSVELIAVCDGLMRLDGGAMFGIVPKSRWALQADPDGQNRITLALRALIVRGARTMIIDAGLGNKEDDAFDAAYGIDRSRNLDHTLAEAGIAPDQIDIVLATHLHFDHAGGFTTRAPDGRLRPTFPRAQYVVRRGEWDAACHPTERTRGSYRADNYVPLADAGVLQMVDDDQTIMPGVRVRRTGGHTMHHQIVLIESAGQTAAFAGDLIPMTAHVADAWIMGYDLYPTDTFAAKQQFVKEAVARNTLVFFTHDPAIAAGYIREQNGKRTVEPATASD